MSPCRNQLTAQSGVHLSVTSGTFHELLPMHNPSDCTSEFEQAAVSGYVWIHTNAYVICMTAICTVLPS